MAIWFTMIAVLGLLHISDDLGVLKAFSPHYAIKLLTIYPKGFWILGAVFLCTTGAEALYSDLGHVGRGNIRISWIFVKTCLLLNYLGQGAWLLNHEGSIFATNQLMQTAGFMQQHPNALELMNPFYMVMPNWFKLPGIIIATAAAIIASQALISGSFTLISEAMRLNLWPKFKIIYPTEARGNYLSLLSIPCCCWVAVVLRFISKSSSNMEAAYGLAITLCMMALPSYLPISWYPEG